MSEVIEKEDTELVLLPPAETALEVYQQQAGLDPYIERIRAEVTGHKQDLTTDKGRKAIASLAFKVRKSKTALDNLGKQLVDDLKEIPKKIDAERKRMRDQLDALAGEVRKPLDEWEAAEGARVAEHRANLECLKAAPTDGMTAENIEMLITCLQSNVIDASWEEFETEAHRVMAASLTAYKAALERQQKYEADQAELARLKVEAEARAKKDEQDRIAREAAEAATKAAEAKAQAERDAAAKREADAKAAQAKAEQGAKDAAERQRRAEEQAETERLASAERAKQAAENARLAEVKRQADEAARIEAETRAREKDRAHKAKIMGAAKVAIMQSGITEDQAREVVKLIAAGKVPNVQINY
ncbi:hypothetical protein PT7_P013 (plasmid) [Pusillimonas sp. T7-7]|uniref:hypothetical protein n=1 Tax=Pusillimonas sp. (strain T7-7) TaxID=1007105 RepID=UPI0002084A84|nr:hypothetical protein [Pusillimonas sp. T7-7]AEC22249.1 hypothetical protein PT7_P013 [Pusillimonas sp. T7-7]